MTQTLAEADRLSVFEKDEVQQMIDKFMAEHVRVKHAKKKAAAPAKAKAPAKPKAKAKAKK